MRSNPGNKPENTKVIQDYTELRVYQLAFEAAMHIYEFSKKGRPRKDTR